MKEKILFTIIFLFLISLPCMAQNFTLQPGDILDITVIQFPDYSKQVTVREDFKIFYPFIPGSIDVRDMDTEQLKGIITEGLKKIIRNPKVSVDVATYAKMEVYISGEVKSSGKYEIKRDGKLLEALVTAGITEGSDLERISIIKGDKQITINVKKLLLGEGDMKNNIKLDSRDIVYVPEINRKVNITGFVNKPGPYVIGEKMHTVLQSIDAAGGLLNLSDTEGTIARKVTLVRKGQTVLSEDLNELYKEGNISANMELEDGDIIFVSQEKTKFMVSVVGQMEKPGIYEIQKGDRLLDVLLMAGGLTKQTIIHNIKVIRRNGDIIPVNVEDLMENGNMEVNIAVEPGDTIFVTKPGKRVVIGGEVKNPGVYTLEEKGTVLDALVMAGAYKKPKLEQIGVFRNINGKSEVIEINAEKLFSVPNPSSEINIQLQKGDVVYIPEGGKFDPTNITVVNSLLWTLTALINLF